MSRTNCSQFYAFDAYLRLFRAERTLLSFLVFLFCIDVVCYAQEKTLERSKKNYAFSFCELASDGVQTKTDYDEILTGRFCFLTDVEASSRSNDVQNQSFSLSSDVCDSVSCYAVDLTIYRAASISDFVIKPYHCRLFGRFDAGFGSQADQGAENATGFDVTSYGAGIGQDWTCTSNLIWGYGLQVNEINIKPTGDVNYKANTDVLAGYLQLGLFGALWHFDVAVGASKNWQEQIELLTADVNKVTSSQRNYEVEFGARFDRGYTRIEPRVNFRVVSLSDPESAESFLISYFLPNEFSDSSYRLRIGSRFSWEYETFLATFKPYLSADWAHEFGNQAIYTIGDSSRYPIAYRFGKHKAARDRLDLGGGLDVSLHHCCDVYMRYDAEFAREYVDYLVDAGVNIKF